MSSNDAPTDVLNLDPVNVPGLITPLQTEGAFGGVNYYMIHSNQAGLVVSIPPYSNMSENDWIEVFWGSGTTAVASGAVSEDDIGEDFSLYVRASRIPEGIHDLYCTVTRAGSGNNESSRPLAILVRTLFPGGIDPEPDLPGHQNLLPAEPELPPSGIIDEDAAKNGIKVRIPGYPNMREFDTLTFSWGGVLLEHPVSADEVAAGEVQLLVTEATIREAGDSDELVLVYRLHDEVHNPSSEWSMRTEVIVEVGDGLFFAPWIDNPDPDAELDDVIDLDVLGDADLLVKVYAERTGDLLEDDVIALKWVGTTALGQVITFEPAAQTVPHVPSHLDFAIANAEVRQLAHGRGVASYSVTRAGTQLGNSKRDFATFIGVEQKLPKPIVEEAVAGFLDPTLAEATVIVPGEALEAGDTVVVTWLGTRANGTPLLRTLRAGVSGGNAGKPMRLTVAGAEAVAPLDGGTLEVHYQLLKMSGAQLDSDRESLRVGEVRAELPAPFTRPPAEDGILDPAELPAQLQLVVASYPDMQAGQTLHLRWQASDGKHFEDFMPISEPMVGLEVVFSLDRERVEENLGAQVELSYRVESPGVPARQSEMVKFMIDSRDGISDGPLLIMGARWPKTYWNQSATPRRLTALDGRTRLPVMAEWRYENDQHWTAASHWLDDRIWSKLYVRSKSETWECRPCNVVGTGYFANSGGRSAFLVLRDEVPGSDGPVVDLVVWGNRYYAGVMDGTAARVDNAVEATAGLDSFVVRLRDGNVIYWQRDYATRVIEGECDLLSSGRLSHVGRNTNGELFAWDSNGTPLRIPEDIQQYTDYMELCSSSYATAALRATGHIVAWGDREEGGQLLEGQDKLNDITTIASSSRAFAALRVNAGSRKVIAWGNPEAGGIAPDEITRLDNVERIAAATFNAFCILLQTGEIKAWPDNNVGGAIPEEIAQLSNIVDVSATRYAFCALLDNGKVKAWGDKLSGGQLTLEVAERSDIVQVVGTSVAFAALCSDGTVVAWGNLQSGGDTRPVAGELVNVVAIYGNCCAFCALTSDGRVVTWGEAAGGGDSKTVQPQLNGKVTARRLLPSAEAEAVNTIGQSGVPEAETNR